MNLTAPMTDVNINSCVQPLTTNTTNIYTEY